MGEKEEEQHTIEAYILGDLSPEEQRHFEQMLKSNPALEQKLLSTQEEIEVIRFHNRQLLKKKFQDIADSKPLVLPKTPPKSIFLSPRTWVIAASLLGILVTVFLWTSQKPSPQVLFAENFRAYPNVIQAQTRGEVGENKPLSQALRNYESGEYLLAEEALTELLKDYPKPEELHFYIAIAQLAQGKAQLAQKNLEEIGSKESPFWEAKEWYRALILLKTGKVEAAKALLSDLVQGQGGYQKKAQKLLENL